MSQIIRSETFDHWLGSLRDSRARAKILARLDRLALGNAGDVKPTRAGVSELRIDYGPGYRVYFTQRGSTSIVILCGGDKRMQNKSIDLAIQMAKAIE